MASNDSINGILSDDVVQYISDRHHVSPQDLIDSIRAEDGRAAGRAVVDDNEYRIIRNLIRIYNEKKNITNHAPRHSVAFWLCGERTRQNKGE